MSVVLATPRFYFRFCISALVVLSVFYYWVLLSIGSYARITSSPGTLNGVHNIERTHLDKVKKMDAGLSDELNRLKHKNKHFIKPTQTKENLQALIDRLQDDLKEAQSRVKLSQDNMKIQKKMFVGKELLDDANRKIIEVSAKNENLLKDITQLRNKKVTTQPFAGLKIVHIDLKGAPPKIDYLIESMLLMKELGAQGFLMEYEDMFPWSGDAAVLEANNSYSMTDIKRIVDTAHKEHLVVIPLVPTFGHLEFALKHKAFRGLRENREMSNSVCPLNNATLPFLENLVKQVQKAHPHSKWLHLGGDEVWNIKTCDRCRQSKLTAAELFIQHVRSMAVFTKTLKSDDGEAVSPIIWDDMMRWWSVEDLKVMSAHITPMVWAYLPDLDNYRKFPKDLWQKYSQAFDSIWLASAFKGALEAWSDFVPVRHHLIITCLG